MKRTRDSDAIAGAVMRAGLGALALLTTMALSGSAHAQLAAGRIDAPLSASKRIGGSDAIAGRGDWQITNGVLCAAVLGVDHEGQLIASGGTLVDLGHCGREDDQFIGLEPLYNLSRDEFLQVSEVRAEVAGGRARIVTEARGYGLEQRNVYALDLDDPTRLSVLTRLERKSEGPRLYAFAELLEHVKSTMRNYVLNTSEPFEGFHHVSLEESRYLDIADATRRVHSVVLIGSDSQGPPIAYAYRPIRMELEQADLAPRTLGHYSLAMESVTVTNVLVDPLWFDADTIGVLQALQGLLMDLEVGEALVYEREIRVSRHGDVAQFSDAIFAAAPDADLTTVRGEVDDPEVRLHFERMPVELAPGRGEGLPSPVTLARPDASGRFSLKLPPGHYLMRAVAPAGRDHDRIFRIPHEAEEIAQQGRVLELGKLRLTPSARLLLPQGSPMRLVFHGRDGTPDPVFGSDLSGLTINGEAIPTSSETRDVHLAGVASDPKHADLPPGRYTVHATRGLEFSVTQTEIELAPAEEKKLEIEAPLRELETPGWISADFHVHAARSFDSTLSTAARLRSFAAEGTEVLVASEHDVVVSHDALIESLGLRDAIAAISGVEVTTVAPNTLTPYTSGHQNVFPIAHDPTLNRGGAIPGERRRLREIIALAKARPGDPLVQLNHPRDPFIPLHDEALFSHLAVVGEPYDPTRPIGTAPNRVLIEKDPVSGLRDVDFDAIELMNGKRAAFYYSVRSDWLSLLRQGFVSTATANSDSHSLGRVVGVPRNYVRLAPDDVRSFAQDSFIAAVRRGELVGTSGPLLDVRLGDVGPGRYFQGREAVLSVDVRAASWVPLSRLRVYVDGEPKHEVALSGPGQHRFDLTFESDAFVFVEVEGEVFESSSIGDESSPDSPRVVKDDARLYAAVLEGYKPLAFSNPIFVDADSDAQWRPVGLPLPVETQAPPHEN